MVFFGAMGFFFKFIFGLLASSLFFCHLNSLINQIKNKFVKDKYLRIINKHLDKLKIAQKTLSKFSVSIQIDDINDLLEKALKKDYKSLKVNQLKAEIEILENLITGSENRRLIDSI